MPFPLADGYRALDRSALSGVPIDAARTLLGCVIVIPAEDVTATITEVEAYGGPAGQRYPDPAAHCFMGPTDRNRAMFGPAGHWYIYRSYGIHFCANITSATDGTGGGVLVRSVRIERGMDAVRRRRGEKPAAAGLGRGPGNVGQALGLDLDDYGADALDPSSRVFVAQPVNVEPDKDIHAGPRVGVRRAANRPWRLWLPDDSVSTYRRHKKAVEEF